MFCRYLENVLSKQNSSKMSCRYLENVLWRQDNFKTIVRCLEDVLCRLGCKPDCKFINFEVKLDFLIKSFFLNEQKVVIKT